MDWNRHTIINLQQRYNVTGIILDRPRAAMPKVTMVGQDRQMTLTHRCRRFKTSKSMLIEYSISSHFPRAAVVLFCKQKLLSVTHDPRLRKPCILSDPLTPPGGKIDWCQTWLGNTQGVRFSQLALCIPQSSADNFTHSILEKIFGSHAETRL